MEERMYRISAVVLMGSLMVGCAPTMKMETIPAAQEAPAGTARSANARVRDYSKCGLSGLRGEGKISARGDVVVIVRNDMQYGCVTAVAQRLGHSFEQKVARDRDGSDLLPAGAVHVIPVGRSEWDGGAVGRGAAIGGALGVGAGILIDVFRGRAPIVRDIADGRVPLAVKTGIAGAVVGVVASQDDPIVLVVDVLVQVWSPEGRTTLEEPVRIVLGDRAYSYYRNRKEKIVAMVDVTGTADNPRISVEAISGRGGRGERFGWW